MKKKEEEGSRRLYKPERIYSVLDVVHGRNHKKNRISINI